MINSALFLFLGTLGWGVSLYLIKILLISLTPVEIVLYRALLGAISLGILAKLLRLRPDSWRHLLVDGFVVGVFNMALPFYFTSMAERTVSSSLAAILNGLTPLCTFLLGLCFYAGEQKMNSFKLLSIFLGLVGIMLINFEAVQERGRVLDQLAMVITCFSYAIAAHYIKSVVRTKEPILVAAMAATWAALIMLVLQLHIAPTGCWGRPDDLIQLGSLLWLGIVGTGLSLYLYCLLIKRIGSIMASMITYLMIMTGVVLGVFLLAEKMPVVVALGCGCVITSLILVSHASCRT